MKELLKDLFNSDCQAKRYLLANYGEDVFVECKQKGYIREEGTVWSLTPAGFNQLDRLIMQSIN